MKANRYNPKLSYSLKNYSQFDEDGIIEHLISCLKTPNKTCVEIGWGSDIVPKRILDFSENCTQNLVQNHNYTCYAYDGKRQNKIPNNVVFIEGKIYPDSCTEIFNNVPSTPDLFSLDIDSFDFEIMNNLFNLGFKPSIVCAEINRKFGYDAVCSMPFVDKTCNEYTAKFWHGVSYKKYRNYFENLGYKFFTLCSSGVNIFFYNPFDINEKNLTSEVLEFITDDGMPRYNENEIRNSIQQHEYWKDFEDDIFK